MHNQNVFAFANCMRCFCSVGQLSDVNMEDWLNMELSLDWKRNTNREMYLVNSAKLFASETCKPKWNLRRVYFVTLFSIHFPITANPHFSNMNTNKSILCTKCKNYPCQTDLEASQLHFWENPAFNLSLYDCWENVLCFNPNILGVSFFFFQIIITKSPRVIARLKKKEALPVSLMFFVCHSKLEWKQGCLVSTEKNV